jgi:hypothetical protein
MSEVESAVNCDKTFDEFVRERRWGELSSVTLA